MVSQSGNLSLTRSQQHHFGSFPDRKTNKSLLWWANNWNYGSSCTQSTIVGSNMQSAYAARTQSAGCHHQTPFWCETKVQYVFSSLFLCHFSNKYGKLNDVGFHLMATLFNNQSLNNSDDSWWWIFSGDDWFVYSLINPRDLKFHPPTSSSQHCHQL